MLFAQVLICSSSEAKGGVGGIILAEGTMVGIVLDTNSNLSHRKALNCSCKQRYLHILHLTFATCCILAQLAKQLSSRVNS